MPIHLFNPLTRRKEEFVPIEPGQVGLSTFGSTV
jgi:cysteinyl-tRNA synthetase